MGSVYHRQLLRVNVSLPGNIGMSYVFNEKHVNSLPNSACKVAHQIIYEVINTLLDNTFKTLDYEF